MILLIDITSGEINKEELDKITLKDLRDIGLYWVHEVSGEGQASIS